MGLVLQHGGLAPFARTARHLTHFATVGFSLALPSESLKSKLGSSSGTRVSDEMLCGAHLSRICEEALVAISASGGKGLPVGYEGLVDKLTTDYMEVRVVGALGDESGRGVFFGSRCKSSCSSNSLLSSRRPFAPVFSSPPPFPFQSHFNLELTAFDRDRLVSISGSYSKARSTNMIFQGDNERKDKEASPMVVEAVRVFMKHTFDELKKLEDKRG